MSLEDKFRELNILHIAFCLGSLFILMLLSSIVGFPFFDALYELDMFFYLGATFALISLIMATKIFNKKTEHLHSLQLNEASHLDLKSAYVLKWALIEGSILMNSVLYFMTQNALHFWIALVLIPILYFYKPTMY